MPGQLRCFAVSGLRELRLISIEGNLDYREVREILKCRGNEVQGIHLGLQRIRAMMGAMANPQARMPVIHIAGTNGKGSVAAMAECILRHAGLRTGLYTSPHLVRLEERIRVSGAPISRRQVTEGASRVIRTERRLLKRGLLDRPLTYFEILTACAFVEFAEHQVDAAVIEVGLGGRLDATNVVDPAVCVITGVAYDHQDLLGHRLEDIAREKAGIIKPAVPVISACVAGIARRVVRKTARLQKAPLVEIDRDCSFQAVNQRHGRFTINLETPQRRYRNLRLSLAGRHQMRNAALAVTAVENLAGFSIKPDAVARGLSAVNWPGRMEEYRAKRRTLLDGAHNPEGAELLAAHLREFGPASIHMVFAAMRDKDIRRMGSALFPLASSIHLARLSNPRSAAPEEIMALHQSFRGMMRIHSRAKDALATAWEECPRSGLAVVTGSLYLLGELLPFLRRVTRH